MAGGIMEIGCYTLDLYCDNSKLQPDGTDGIHEYKAFPDQYTGNSRANCVRKAKKDGWKWVGEHQYCPKCAPNVFNSKKPKSK